MTESTPLLCCVDFWSHDGRFAIESWPPIPFFVQEYVSAKVVSVFVFVFKR